GRGLGGGGWGGGGGEAVGEASGGGGDRGGRPPLGRLGGDRGKVGQPLDQVALLALEDGRGSAADRMAFGVAENARDARVRVLNVVDGVLLRALGGEVDVDVDRLVGPARDEE